MDQLSEWIKDKLSQGFSVEQVKKALSEEGFDPTLVDAVLDNKKTVHHLKNHLILITIILSLLLISLLFLIVNLDNTLPSQEEKSLINVSFNNESRFNLFLDKGFFVTTDKIKFNVIDDALQYTNLSNKTLDIVILKVSKFDEPIEQTVNFVEENLNSTYPSKFLKSSEQLYHNNHKMIRKEYVVIERNIRRIIENAFIDFDNRTLYISYKCNEEDKQQCDSLFVEALEHISLI
ncbi:MAG: hypothetical protein PWP03_781 [Candidatus Woesearchaeota archaeon]|nr:hypothetical protein [Candidatus Woesearchaeota archaeon]